MKHLISAAIASLTIATGASAERYNPYSPEDPGYADVMRNYGKEMLFAKYSARLCPEYKLSYNERYFSNGPADLWDHNRFDKFMNAVMHETKIKMDAQYALLGHERFCKATMEFFAANYTQDKRPVKIEGK